MTEDELSDQIEWLHTFAEQSPVQLAQQANAANRSAIARLIETCLYDCNAPEQQSPEEFASSVLELRENERQWNRALCAALIRSDDQNTSLSSQSATASLKLFAKSCPWRLFREVALDQASNYGYQD